MSDVANAYRGNGRWETKINEARRTF